MQLAQLRSQLEQVIAPPPVAADALPTGFRELDEALGGGLPRGRLTELIGPLGAGTATLVHALVSAALGRGQGVACIDASRTLDPAGWASLDCDFLRVVRPRDPARGAWCADVLLRSGAFTLVVLDSAPHAHAAGGASPRRPRARQGCGVRRGRRWIGVAGGRGRAHGDETPMGRWAAATIRAHRSSRRPSYHDRGSQCHLSSASPVYASRSSRSARCGWTASRRPGSRPGRQAMEGRAQRGTHPRSMSPRTGTSARSPSHSVNASSSPPRRPRHSACVTA